MHQEAPQRVVGHEPPIEEAGESRPQSRLTKLGEKQRHGPVRCGDPAAGAHRVVEALVDETQHLGFVGHREAGVEVGFEGELAKQRDRTRRSC